MKRLLLLALLVGCGRDNALVDGECAAGYELDGDTCVRLADATTLDGDASLDAPDDGNLDGTVGDAPVSDGQPDAFSCDDGLTLCEGTCVDTSSDPFNCGACGVVCPSLLCQSGVCQGAVPGSFVVVGHDFALSYSAAQARVLANALLLSPATNIRVRSYEQYADATAVANVKSILNMAAMSAGRTITYTAATAPSDVSPGMSSLNTDVLLIYDQPNAPANSLGAIGAGWATTIGNFAHVGGVVIALDGAGGAKPQMPALIQSAGILGVTGDTSISPSTPLNVVAPADAVGLGVVSPYGAGKRSVYFACTEQNGGSVTYVVEDPKGDAGPTQAVVVHKVAP